MRIRDAADDDLSEIERIYAWYVSNSVATFEETPPSIDDLDARRTEILALDLPYLVAVSGDEVAGFAYASLYRSRPAYRFTVEDSIYVREDLHRQGAGTALLSELIRRCESGVWKQMIAVIGDSGNNSSIALHKRFGFVHIGTLHSVGFKLGRWVDTALMQRPLGI